MSKFSRTCKCRCIVRERFIHESKKDERGDQNDGDERSNQNGKSPRKSGKYQAAEDPAPAQSQECSSMHEQLGFCIQQCLMEKGKQRSNNAGRQGENDVGSQRKNDAETQNKNDTDTKSENDTDTKSENDDKFDFGSL